jgi:hypothetical protein
MARDSRLWQNPLAHARIFEGDAAECSKWYAWAQQKLRFMLANHPGATSQVFVPIADVTVKVDTRPNRIYIRSGEVEDALILRLAADGYEDGWGKPYISGIGTPGGHNPWRIIRTSKDVTSVAITKGLPVEYFTANDEITYSDVPNTGNCYWGLPGNEITWVGPYNQIGPIYVDMDDTYGGVLSNVRAYTEFPSEHPDDLIWVSPQFGKDIFANKEVIASFSNFVLGACKRVIDEIPYVIALTASSLHSTAGLTYRIEVFNTLSSAYSVAYEIDIQAAYGNIPTHAAAFNLAGSECICAVSVVYISDSPDPIDITTPRISPFGKSKYLKVNLASLDSVSHTLSDIPLPEGAAANKRLSSPAGFVDHTSQNIQYTLIGYGYEYETDTEIRAYLIYVSERYFGGLIQVSYIQVGDRIEVHPKTTNSALAISSSLKAGYIAQWEAETGSSLTDLYYSMDGGVYAYQPVTVYSNMQYKQLGVLTRTSNSFPLGTPYPSGTLPLERRATLYTAICKEGIKTIGVCYDDKIESLFFFPQASRSLGNGNLVGKTDETSVQGAWSGPFPLLPVTFSGRGCSFITFRTSAPEDLPDGSSTAGNLYDFYEKRCWNYERLFPNGVSHTKYSLGSYSITGPFSWIYKGSSSGIPPFPDLPNVFSAHLQVAGTLEPTPSDYKPIKNISGSLGFTTEEMPRIRGARLL